MGISSTTNRTSYTGDGSSTIFSFPYYFFSPSDLAVYLFDTGSSAVATQALNTNYTVSGTTNSQGVYPSGGSVVMNSAFPSSLQIVITRSPSPVQNFALLQNAPINSLALVQQLDYLTALVQRLQDEVSRSIQLPDGVGTIGGVSFNQTLPSSILLGSSANAPLVLNSGANGWTFGVVATGAGSPISYAGTLPVVNGGTGQSGALTQFGVWYSATGSTMAQTAVGPLNQFLTGQGSAAPTWTNVNFSQITGSIASTAISGVLTPAQGGTGTGQSSFVQYGVVYASSTSQLSVVPSAASGWPLVAQGSNAPQYSQISLGSSAGLIGVLPIANGGTGQGAQAPAFNGLSPATTQGAVSWFNQSSNVSLGVGLVNQVLSVQANSSLAWTSVTALSTLSVATKTANYNAATTDDVILIGSGCQIVNLYGASGNAGKRIYVKNTNNSLDIASLVGSNATIDAQTALTFGTFEEAYTVLCDGTNWQILEHFNTTGWSTPQSSVITAQTLNPAKGVGASDTLVWKRVGNTADVAWRLSQTTAGSTGTGDYILSLPSGLKINTSVFPAYNSGVGVSLTGIVAAYPSQLPSHGILAAAGQTSYQQPLQMFVYSSTAIRICGASGWASGGTMWGSGGTSLGGAIGVALNFSVPIANWYQ